MKIVVIGGTGLIGSKTVAILRQSGHEVVAASPKTGVNTITGENRSAGAPLLRTWATRRSIVALFPVPGPAIKRI